MGKESINYNFGFNSNYNREVKKYKYDGYLKMIIRL